MENPFKPPERKERPPFRVEELQLLGDRAEQQDAAGVKEIETANGRVLAVVVADGHGDHGGSFARLAAHELLASFEERRGAGESSVHAAFGRAQEALRATGEGDGGATATVVLLRGHTATVGWVGNSEARLFTRGGFLTVTPPHEYGKNRTETERLSGLHANILNRSSRRISRATLDEADRPSSDALYVYNEQRGLALEVSRSLGDFEMDPYVSHEPDVKQVILSPDARFLVVATDGLWGMMNEDATHEKVVEAFGRARSADDAKKKLETILHAASPQDNVTVLIVEIPKTL